MRKQFIVLAACALAVGAVAAGCGSNDDSSSDETNSDALSKQEFIKQADAICATGNEKLDAAGKELGQNPSKSQQEAFASGDIVPTIQTEVDQIGALAAPQGDEEEIDAILTAAQDGLDTIDADPSAFTGNGPNPFAEANKLATEYGLKVCGR